MSESPVNVLMRWEEHGAQWEVLHLSADHAVVELQACTGEPMDRLESGDPELIAFLRGRRTGGDARQG